MCAKGCVKGMLGTYTEQSGQATGHTTQQGMCWQKQGIQAECTHVIGMRACNDNMHGAKMGMLQHGVAWGGKINTKYKGRGWGRGRGRGNGGRAIQPAFVIQKGWEASVGRF